MLYRDRSDAGRQLAAALQEYAGRDDVIVLGLPRGGIPVAFEVARALELPLDMVLVRKLGVPGQEELAMGAISTGGACVLNDDVLGWMNIPREVIEQAIERESVELARRESLYRGDRPPPAIKGKTVILIDDGLATGSTMRAAIRGLLQLSPARIIAAVPLAPAQTCAEIRRIDKKVDCLCLATPEPFYAVGQGYRVFDQTSDDEVRELMKKADHWSASS
ncbi:MAG: phosphoribosyltransferase [Blastocatellales bacterium]